jgi:hypothetical protein
LLGSSTEADVQVAGAAPSHATLAWLDNSLFVTALQPTFLDGVELRQEVRYSLASSSVLRLGDSEIRVEYDQQAVRSVGQELLAAAFLQGFKATANMEVKKILDDLT